MCCDYSVVQPKGVLLKCFLDARKELWAHRWVLGHGAVVNSGCGTEVHYYQIIVVQCGG